MASGHAQGLRPWSELEPLGKCLDALIRDVSWVNRRVDTVVFVDRRTLERAVTLDIDLAAVRDVALTAGVQPDDVLLPLTLLSKGLLLDFDMRDASGSALAIVPSSVDAEASQALMLHSLAKEKVDVSTLPQSIRRIMYRAAACQPSAEDQAQLANAEFTAGSVQAWRLEPDLYGDEARWHELLDAHDDFWSFMVNFTTSFMLMTTVNASQGGTLILKYRYLETPGSAKPSVRQRLCLDAFQYLADVPAAGMAAREHLRHQAPEGLFFETALLWESSERSSGRATAASSSMTYRQRVTARHLAIYTSDVRPSNYELAFTLRPSVAGFLSMARYTVAALLILLTAGAVAQLDGERLSAGGDAAKAEPIIALLVFVPSVLAAFLAREGEHELLSFLLRWPRMCVAAAGFAGLAAGGAIIVGVTGQTLGFVWLVATLVTLGIFCLLDEVIRRAKAAFRETARNAYRTEAFDITTLTYI